MDDFDVVVIGTSAGGLSALESILSRLDNSISVPFIIVQHLSPDSGDSITNILRKYSVIGLTEPVDKETIESNHVYLAPADYHIMVEKDRTISLNLGPKENFCRPAIDILFETAAEVYLDRTLGIVLTGANIDGTKGSLAIKRLMGKVIVQQPAEALISVMPQSVINSGAADYILTLNEIVDMLNRVLRRG